MPVSFEKLRIGSTYDRPHLANIWGYKDFHAISKGVVTPNESKYIVLFVTKEKQNSLTQYNDYIDGELLFWEGEAKHATDRRIINASKSEHEIHLFYREMHHADFVYYGPIRLLEYEIHSTKPSEFIFQIGNRPITPDPFDDIRRHAIEFRTHTKTEQQAIIKSRIGQGIFREALIKIWGACSVTGVKNLQLLKASHIKPWRDSSNEERLDPYNGLLLIPNLDALFDEGFITFDHKGRIIISDRLSINDLKLLNIDKNVRLRRLFPENEKYLDYHRNTMFLKWQ